MSEFLQMSRSTSEWLAITAVIIFLIMLFFMKRQKTKAQRLVKFEQLDLSRQFLGEFQRHRGLSHGVLQGDLSLKSDLEVARKKINQLVYKAQLLPASALTELTAILKPWQKILKDSDHDRINNLMNHHQLIRNTAYLIEDIGSGLDLPMSLSKKRELNYIWHEIIQVSEWAGQARALGTEIAANHNCDAKQRIRLKFLKEKIHTQSSDAFKALNRCQGLNLNLQACEKNVQSLLQCLEVELLNRDKPEIDSKQYFKRASGAINELLTIVSVTTQQLKEKYS